MSDRIQELVAANASLLRELNKLRAELEECKANAERYVWLRAQHWSDNTLAVVKAPKDAVQVGRECPYGALLDGAIDRMRQGKQP